jgi:hypothetical protein
MFGWVQVSEKKHLSAIKPTNFWTQFHKLTQRFCFFLFFRERAPTNTKPDHFTQTREKRVKTTPKRVKFA